MSIDLDIYIYIVLLAKLLSIFFYLHSYFALFKASTNYSIPINDNVYSIANIVYMFNPR